MLIRMCIMSNEYKFDKVRKCHTFLLLIDYQFISRIFERDRNMNKIWYTKIYKSLNFSNLISNCKVYYKPIHKIIFEMSMIEDENSNV